MADWKAITDPKNLNQSIQSQQIRKSAKVDGSLTSRSGQDWSHQMKVQSQVQQQQQYNTLRLSQSETKLDAKDFNLLKDEETWLDNVVLLNEEA